MTWLVVDAFFRDNDKYCTKHHIDAYNDFVRNKMPMAIKQIPIKVVRINEKTGALKHEISVHIGGLEGKDIFPSKPVYVDGDNVRPLYPNDALVKSLYYASDVYTNVTIQYKSGETGIVKNVQFPNVRIGSIPIMVHSCLCVLHEQPPTVVREMGSCKYDQGGYFIADGGKEKVIISQERIVTNRIFISKPDGNDATQHALNAMIQCTTEKDPFQKTVIMSLNNDRHKQRNAIHVRLSKDIPEDVPIFAAFRALGVESDRRIMQHIVGDVDDPSNKDLVDFLYYSAVDNPNNIYTQTDALEYLKQFVRFKDVEHVRHIIVNDFLRNAEDMRQKAIMFGDLIRKLVKTHIGQLPLQSRDDFMNKRVDSAGVLMYDLFLEFYNNLRRDIRRQIDRAYSLGAWYDKDDIENFIKPSEISTIIDASIITDSMKAALKGRWPGVDKEPEKAGIVQDLNRVSYVSYQSHVRRLNTPMERDLKLAQPRRLHNTQWGVTCPYQSPDGASIGLDKHLAVLTHITIETGSEPIRKCLLDLGCTVVDDVGIAELRAKTHVYVNNDLFALTEDPHKLVTTLRLFRRNGLINAFVSVTWNYMTKEVHVFTQSGRLTRPLLIVQDGRLDDIVGSWSWHRLFTGFNKDRDLYDPRYNSMDELKVTVDDLKKTQAPLEFIDVEEGGNTMVAMYPSDIKDNPKHMYTHCEIHPSTTLSLYTNTIPFANHNQAPRIVFSGAQGKQAVGVYATNFNIRMDTMSYVLHHPQRPLVTTRYNRLSKVDELPNGENLIVAIACYTGYNQEDAIIVNRNSIERGMFNLTYFKSFLETETNDPMKGQSVMFCNPHTLADKNVDVKLKHANILTVDDHGMPRPNARIDEGDLVMGKLSMTTSVDGNKRTTVLRDTSKRADKTIEGIIDRTVVFKDERNELNAKVRMRTFRMPMIGDKMASRHGQKGVCGIIIPQEDMPFAHGTGIVPDIIINPHAIPTRMTVGHLLECVLAKSVAMEGCLAESTVFETQDVNAYGKILEKHGYERHGNEIMYNGFTGEQMETAIFFGPTFYFRLKHQAADKINYRATGLVSTMTRQPVRGRAVDGGLRIGEMERDCILANGMLSFMKESFIDRSDAFQFKASARSSLVMPYSMKALIQEAHSIGIDMIPKTEGSWEDEYFMDDSIDRLMDAV